MSLCGEIPITFPGDGEGLVGDDERVSKLNVVFVRTGSKTRIGGLTLHRNRLVDIMQLAKALEVPSVVVIKGIPMH